MDIKFIESIEQLGIEITENLLDKKLIDLKPLLQQYIGTDWKNYIIKNENNYNRYLVFTNNIIDIFIITWNINQSSKIHNHPDYGCLLKVLQGQLTEYIYFKKDNLFIQTKENILNENMIGYQIGKNGLHKILNTNEHISVSIHIYSPSGYITQNFDE